MIDILSNDIFYFTDCLVKTAESSVHYYWLSRSKFGSFSLVEPGNVSPAQPVPDDIARPPWADSGEPADPPATAECKTLEDLTKMRRACRLASKILHAAKHLAKASISR